MRHLQTFSIEAKALAPKLSNKMETAVAKLMEAAKTKTFRCSCCYKCPDSDDRAVWLDDMARILRDNLTNALSAEARKAPDLVWKDLCSVSKCNHHIARTPLGNYQIIGQSLIFNPIDVLYQHNVIECREDQMKMAANNHYQGLVNSIWGEDAK